jgi:L-asparaginase
VPIERDDGMVGSGDLNPQKARVLLMLALSRSSEPRDVAQIFQAQQ